MRAINVRTVLGVSCLGLLGCGGSGAPDGDGSVGSLRAAIELSGLRHDVSAIRFDVVAPDQACDSVPAFSKTIALESEAVPASLTDSGAHPFADGLFILPPGSYRVCATPLAAEGPSLECAAVDAVEEVTAGFTAEAVLFSQCQGDATGGLDVVVGLNDQPQITDVSLAPSKFISVCESVEISAIASDPNGDALSYAWSVSTGPDGSSLRANGAAATFSGPAGDYVLSLNVDDGHGGHAFLEFPIHITAAVCAVPDAIQNIFTQGCSPCHTVGSSGGLHLDPAVTSYANLVNVNARGTACTSRVRVVPGDAASSYLIAKLRGATGICGLPMPRNRPSLPEEQIQAIESWINGLPH